MLDVLKFSSISVKIELDMIQSRMFPSPAHAIAEVIVAQMKLEPKVVPEKNGLPQHYLIANYPRCGTRDECHHHQEQGTDITAAERGAA